MRRKAMFILILTVVFAVFSFASLLETIKERGKLIIGTEPTFPPFEYVDKNNNIVGFDIDLAKVIATRLGVSLEVASLPFDSLIPALVQGKIDLIIAGMTITEERAKVVDFSIPYLNANQAIVVRGGEEFNPQTLEDLKGHKVAVQLGTTGDLAVSKIKGVKVVRFQRFTDAFLELGAKRVDAVVLDEAPARAYIKTFPKFVISAVIDTGERYGIAVKKGEKELLDFVNQTLIDLMKSPYDRLLEKWFEQAQ